MAVTAVRKLAEVAERIGNGEDARQAILSSISAHCLDDYEPFLNHVLVATYVRSDKLKSGLIIGGDRTRAEDRFQGSVGLVLKVGPTAFVDDVVVKFGGVKVVPGDWVHYNTSDAREFFFVDANSPLDGTSVRLIEDAKIKARVKDPQSVY